MVQQLSTPDILYEKPENSFVAEFIGENNTLIGTLKKEDDEYCEVDLDGGGTVKALKINVGSIGEKTKLSIRPERVVIDSKNSADNIFEGMVKELIYLGDHIRARLNVCGDENFIVKIPNEGNLDIKENSKIHVSWNPKDIRPLDYS